MPKSTFSPKLTTLRQEYPAECGLVALAGLAMSEVGADSALEALRKQSRKVNQGTSFADLVALGANLGLKLVAVEATIDELLDHGKVSILHWEESHFVKYVGYKK